MDITLLEKFIKGECTEEEATRVKAWLEEDPDALDRYMQETWEEDITHPMPVDTERSLLQNLPQERKLRRIPMAAWWSAAAVVLLLLGGWWFFHQSSSPRHITENAMVLSVPGKYNLPDGSSIWLKEDTRIAYDTLTFGRNGRVVEVLEGEVFFDVKPDFAHVFLVKTGETETRVLGTSFGVEYHGYTSVAVATGKVGVLVKGKDAGVLVPGNRLLVRKDGEMEKTDQPAWLPGLWKENSLQLTNAGFAELKLALHELYDIHLETNSTQVKGQLYNIQLHRGAPPAEVINVLGMLNGIKYDKKNDTTYIIN